MGRRVAVETVESRVRSRRVAAGLSQQGLASLAGLTRQAVSAIESGQYVPNTVVALRLARALGCTVEDLFQVPEEPSRVDAELVGSVPAGETAAAEPLRVQLARVGGRVVARGLTGVSGTLTAADGLVTSPPTRTRAPVRRDGPGSRPSVAVDLLVDPRVIENTVVVLGCDPALALLGAHLSRRHPALRLVWAHAGSLAALRALARGEAHAAGTHLRDPETGEYNLPYVRRELRGRHVHVVTLSQWQQGLIVAPGNPRGIRGVADLGRPDVTIVNREPGSGSRALLETMLREAGIDPARVPGYGREVASHLAVAETVAAGVADAGPGILAAARAFGLDFIPLQEERFDLVLPSEHLDAPPVQALLEVAVSPAYRAEVESLGGYDISRAGTIVAALS